MEPFAGSVEVISGDDSRGVPGTSWTVAAVPVVVGAIEGVTDLEEVDPEAQATGRTPEAQWAGRDAHGVPVRVLLWRQRREDLFPPPLPNPEDGQEGG